MAKRTNRQLTARQGNQEVVHNSYEEDDNMLPSPEQLQQYQQLDPNFIQWFMNRADLEQNARIKFNADKIDIAKSVNRKLFTIDMSVIISATIVFIAALAFSALLLLNDHPISGSIIGGGSVLVFTTSLLRFRKSNTKNQK
jgi:uncharacterized membrane protein